MTDHAMPVTGNTEHTRPENRAFFPALDGLRAIAFLMVFLQHYASLPWGWSGVNVFFVLSGFLITGILFDSRNDPHRARNFYVRRTLRIFPLYYGVLLFLLMLHAYFHWNWSAWWLAWPLYVGNFLRFLSPSTTVNGTPEELAADAHLGSPRLGSGDLYLGHFWSLCVEEQFYLIWPWIVFWVRSRRALLWICGLTVLVALSARLVAQHVAPGWMLQQELLYRFTFFQFDALLLGGLVALLYRGPLKDRLVAGGRTLSWVGIITALLYVGLTRPRHGHINWPYPSWKFTWGLLFVDVLSAALILACVSETGPIQRVLRSKPLRWVGRISYGAYVLHDIPHNLYGSAALHLSHHSSFFSHRVGIATVLIALPATLVLSWLSFRFFESPFLALKEKWTLRAG